MPAQIGGHEKNILYVGVLNYLKNRIFLDTGVRQKLLNPIPAYTKHGFHPGKFSVNLTFSQAKLQLYQLEPKSKKRLILYVLPQSSEIPDE